MKIRLMTFHTPKNYGAVFQAYSLMSVLKTKCDDLKIIDFNTPHLRSLYPIIPKISGIKGLVHTILSFYTYPFKYKKYKKFENFVNQYLELTKRYESVEQLYKEKWSEDIVFVCGSDQVFNPNRITEEQQAFYMDFVPEINYKFSYAASFGRAEFPKEKIQSVKNFLEKLDSISVREKSGVDIVKTICDKNVIDVIDPTLLNDMEFWKKCEKPYKKTFSHYLLYYRLMGTKDSDFIAMKKAKENNLKLIVVTEGMLTGLKCDYVLRDVGPEELLWLYHHADYIVSNSFHGIAFAVIYEKPFVFSNVNTVFSDRGTNLMRQLEIDKNDVYGIEASGRISYEIINKKLKEQRKIANDFIDQSIRESENKVLKNED